MRNFMELVESTNQRLKEEEEVVELSAEEQKQYFKGWMMAKAGEDKTYLANNIEDIADDFREDATPWGGADSITLEPMEFDDEIKQMKERLESTPEEEEAPEEGGEEAPVIDEPVVDEPVADEIGEPVGDDAGEEAPEEEDAVDEDLNY